MRGRLLGVSGDPYGHVRVLVGPHDGERDEEGEDLHDGTGGERERREGRDDGIAVEDEAKRRSQFWGRAREPSIPRCGRRCGGGPSRARSGR